MTGGEKFDVIILGAGAAGMMCAIEAGRRGRKVLVIDHARNPGEKIRISGGGRCNFTNLHSTSANFLSSNPHFAKSALSAYGPADFLAKVERHGIAWHEKAAGQLFCDGSAKQIVSMLTGDMQEAGCRLLTGQPVRQIDRLEDGGFRLECDAGPFFCRSLVVATGGKSIPKMGATGFGHELAARFGHTVSPLRAGLVPFTWPSDMAESWSELSGVSLPVRATCGRTTFDEAMLITHRGLSGPAMLQISSYWQDGEAVLIDLAPGIDVLERLTEARSSAPKSHLAAVMAEFMPKRLADRLAEVHRADARQAALRRMADHSNVDLERIARSIDAFRFVPGGTEGYRTAEVTVGGVATDGLNQKTLESRLVPGLYFIGEVVDVTGHLGGHNFQWAWASGHAAGRAC